MFPKLFESGKIGKLELSNRMIMAPMVTRFASFDGSVTDQLIDYYLARARGGVGLIVIEASYPRSSGYPGRLYLSDNKYIPGLRKLVEALHQECTPVCLQINPSRGRSDEVESVSASEIVHPVTGLRPRALELPEIHRMVKDFGEGVRRAVEAGFDAIQIHGASGYLVCEFLSPLTNRRNDGYGGSLEGRARLATELVEETKRACLLYTSPSPRDRS